MTKQEPVNVLNGAMPFFILIMVCSYSFMRNSKCLNVYFKNKVWTAVPTTVTYTVYINGDKIL